MMDAKAAVRAKLVEFQRRIAGLTLTLSQERERHARRERSLALDLLDIADAFDNLEEVVRAKEDLMDKATRHLAGNLRAIHRKLVRHLEACNMTPMELLGRPATMEHCEVVETRHDAHRPGATVLAVVKAGYVDPRDGVVIRKAQVVTAAAPSGSD